MRGLHWTLIHISKNATSLVVCVHVLIPIIQARTMQGKLLSLGIEDFVGGSDVAALDPEHRWDETKKLVLDAFVSSKGKVMYISCNSLTS